jgi:hypothetical protein
MRLFPALDLTQLGQESHAAEQEKADGSGKNYSVRDLRKNLIKAEDGDKTAYHSH